MTHRYAGSLLAGLLVVCLPWRALAQDGGVPLPEPEPESPPAEGASPEPTPESPPVESPAPGADEGFTDDDLLDEITADIDAEGGGQAPDATQGAAPDAATPGGAETAPAAGEPAQPDLEDAATLTLPETVVHYTQEDVLRTGGSVSLVSQEDLETHEYSDPHRVLLRVPGVYVRGEDGFGLRPNIGMRGTRSDRSGSITLMEDGVLLGPAPYSAPAAYYFPLITRMVGVEVFKGPSAILYGPQTVGGAINFLTREVPQARGGQIDFSYGMFRSRKLHFHYGASNRWGGILFEGLDLYNRGFKHIDFAGGETGFHRNEFMLRSFVQTNPNGHVYNRLELKLGYSHELSYETYTGITDADFRDDPYRRYAASQRDRMHWNRFQVELRHRLSVGEHFDLFTVAYRHDFHRIWRKLNGFDSGPSLYSVLTNPDVPSNRPYLDVLRGDADSAIGQALLLGVNDRTYVSEGVQTRGRLRLETGEVHHEVEAGLRLHYDSIDRHHGSEGYDMINGTLVPDGVLRNDTANALSSAIAFAAYVMYAIDYRGLRITPGVRAEVIHTRVEDHLDADGNTLADPTVATANQHVFLPGIGLQYAINEWLGVLAGVHRGFAPVGPGQLPGVRPEQSISVEGGFRVHHEDAGIDAEAVAFYNSYSNLLLSCGATSGCTGGETGQQFNAGSANIEGVEVLYAHAIGITDDISLPLRLTYTFTQARLRDVAATVGTPDFLDAKDGDRLPYVPMHQANLEIGLDWNDLGVRIAGTLLGKMLEQAGEANEVLMTDRYVMLDVVANYQVRPRAQIYTRFENITNSQPITSRRPFGARPARPFMAEVGLKIDL